MTQASHTDRDAALALYIHWPFCLHKCPYCDFNSHVRDTIPQARFGAALRRANHRSDARAPLRDGLDLAHRCGATALVARAGEELAAAGARPRTPLRTGFEALSPSERRVARLAADGRSNRDIAQALFVSTKTVEVHLSACYRKLGITSRAGLPAVVE